MPPRRAMPLKRESDAIVRVSVVVANKDTSFGTGFVAAPGKVLTAWHVVGQKGTDKLLPGNIQVRFPGGEPTDAKCTASDAALDFAVLDCAVPAGVRPLPLRDCSAIPSGLAWISWGYPNVLAATAKDGLTVRGEVKNQALPMPRDTLIELFCEETAAGQGPDMRGLSGGPCIVDGYVVGVMRLALLDNDFHARAGTLYAAKISLIVQKCSDLQLYRLAEFEELITGLLQDCPLPALLKSASALGADVEASMNEVQLAGALARGMLAGGPQPTVRGLAHLHRHLDAPAMTEILEAVSTHWVLAAHVDGMREVLKGQRSLAAMLLSGSCSETADLYLLRAKCTRNGWTQVTVLGDGGVEEVRHQVQEELRKELCRRGNADLKKRLASLSLPLVLTLIYDAFLPEVIEVVREELKPSSAHILWLTSQQAPPEAVAKLQDARLLEPPLEAEVESEHVGKYKDALDDIAGFSR